MAALRFRSPAWDALTLWALDLETGGIDPAQHAVLAVGMVPIRAGVIRLGEAYATLVRPEGGRAFGADAVRAHGLVPGDVRDAPGLGEVLREVERRLAGQVLLVHGEALDVPFLARGFGEAGLRWPAPRAVVDTVRLLGRAARRARFTEVAAAHGAPPALALGEARAALGLPAYAAHDALTDAVATAELFLVLRHRLGAKTLRELR